MDIQQEEEYYDVADDQLLPRDLRKLRACLICGLVKSWDQFHRYDCENCKAYLAANDFANECTTTNFDGMISLMKPETSWVAKWQRTTTRVPGCYAVCVHGRLPSHMVSALEESGIEYYPLDSTEQ